MRCLDCHYNLSKLPEHRCPECGREFDPKNRRTFFSHADLETWKGDRNFWYAVLVVLLCLLPLLMLIITVGVLRLVNPD